MKINLLATVDILKIDEKNVLGVKLGLSKDDSKGWISRNGSLALIVVFFIIFNRLKIRVVAAGCSDLNAVGIAVRVWGSVVIRAFGTATDFVKWIRRIS